MSLIEQLFGRAAPSGNVPDAETCRHERLLARYRNQDALTAEQPMGYKCQRCLAEFLPRAAQPMLARAAAVAAEEAPAEDTEEDGGEAETG